MIQAINWFGYFNQADGYGRLNSRFVRALQKKIDCTAYHIGVLDMPGWMLWQQPIRTDKMVLNITCAPPYMVKKVLGRHWLYTMTEGSRILPSWVEAIEKAGLERILVPCHHNLVAFRDSGIAVPISVVPAGTDPNEFELLDRGDKPAWSYRPYTFLAFDDRGERKGFPEVWDAFYLAFGGKTTGNLNVRLIVKGRVKDRSLSSILSKAQDRDARVTFFEHDALDMQNIYAQADCLVLPSRSEGWGMIHREAACMGLPVITQRYSGLDDGHLEEWALVVERGELKPIPPEVCTALGEWRIVDKDALAQAMKFCYDSPETASAFGKKAAQWIRENQTWDDAALTLLSLIGFVDHALSVERATV